MPNLFFILQVCLAFQGQVADDILRAISRSTSPIVIILLSISLVIVLLRYGYQKGKKTQESPVVNEEEIQKFIKKQKELVASGKSANVINNLLGNESIPMEKEVLNEIIMLSSRYQKVKREIIKGFDGTAEKMARIEASVLDILDSLSTVSKDN